jgi:hypothetical protein
VLAACPDLEWRLIVALSRYGGLRCPSEHQALTWPDIDWERSRFLVTAPKTEHHDGKGERWVPIFPELRPYLEEAFELAEPGALHVITHHRGDRTKNLRTRLRRIIRRAGLTPWPKPFHNLRASRETDLAATYPLHVVCSWIGNSAVIAKNHYLQVTDADFEKGAATEALRNPVQRALQNPVRRSAAPSGAESASKVEEHEANRSAPLGAASCRPAQSEKVRLEGFEPSTFGSVAGRQHAPSSLPGLTKTLDAAALADFLAQLGIPEPLGEAIVAMARLQRSEGRAA